MLQTQKTFSKMDTIMNKSIITIIFVIFLFSSLIFANGDHKKQNAIHMQDTLTIVAGDTIAINGIATETFLANKKAAEKKISSQTEDEGTSEPKEISFDALFEHIHNKVIHFPIALGVLLFLFMTIGYKQEICYRASKIIVLFGALATIVAVITGLTQASHFEGTATYALVEVHRAIGFVVLTIYLIMSWAVLSRQSNKMLLILSILLLIAISAAGLYGGVIAH